MRSRLNYMPYTTANDDIRKLAKYKYLRDPESAVKCMPNHVHTELLDVIEVLYNEEYVYVTVSKEDLRSIHWDAYLDSSDDEIYLPYSDGDYESDLLEEEYELY